jgi:hypothetical protein
LKRIHDAPDRAEQADVRARGADGRQERHILLQRVDLARQRHLHRALCGIGDRHRRQPVLPVQTHVFLEAGDKNVLHAAQILLAAHLIVKFGEIRTRPKTLFELIGRRTRIFDHRPLADDHRPRHDAGCQQHQHDQLHDKTGPGD